MICKSVLVFAFYVYAAQGSIGIEEKSGTDDAFADSRMMQRWWPDS